MMHYLWLYTLIFIDFVWIVVTFVEYVNFKKYYPYCRYTFTTGTKTFISFHATLFSILWLYSFCLWLS